MDPKVIDDLLDAVLQGLGDKKKYDWARKILALVSILRGDAKNPERAAQQADEELYKNHIESKVGSGTMTEDEATEELMDRETASFVILARKLVAHGVEVGCIAAGTAIGTWLGNPALGKTIGGVVGHFLNKPVGDVVEIGARRILDFTTNIVTAIREKCEEKWKRAKEWLKTAGQEQEKRLERRIRGTRPIATA